MNTTALLVDILIIGIQVSLWLAGFIFSFVSPCKQFVSLMEKSPGSSFIILIAGFYTLGIIFDPIISIIFTWFKTKKEKEIYQEGLLISILIFNKETYNIIDNQYARLRIARATVINFFLITISACCFYITNPTILKMTSCHPIFLISSIGLILMILSIVGWYKRNRTYFGYITETIKTMNKT